MGLIDFYKKYKADMASAAVAIERAKLVWPGAHRVVDFYKGYPYVFAVPWQCYNNEYWSQFTDPGEGIGLLMEWCREHEFKEFRSDIHRVNLQHGIGVGGHITSDYFFDEMGGGDVTFFAFTNDQDFCFFALRWGYVAS
jgi:hypothetical protein